MQNSRNTLKLRQRCIWSNGIQTNSTEAGNCLACSHRYRTMTRNCLNLQHSWHWKWPPHSPGSSFASCSGRAQETRTTHDCINARAVPAEKLIVNYHSLSKSRALNQWQQVQHRLSIGWVSSCKPHLTVWASNVGQKDELELKAKPSARHLSLLIWWPWNCISECISACINCESATVIRRGLAYGKAHNWHAHKSKNNKFQIL